LGTSAPGASTRGQVTSIIVTHTVSPRSGRRSLAFHIIHNHISITYSLRISSRVRVLDKTNRASRTNHSRRSGPSHSSWGQVSRMTPAVGWHHSTLSMTGRSARPQSRSTKPRLQKTSTEDSCSVYSWKDIVLLARAHGAIDQAFFQLTSIHCPCSWSKAQVVGLTQLIRTFYDPLTLADIAEVIT